MIPLSSAEWGYLLAKLDGQEVPREIEDGLDLVGLRHKMQAARIRQIAREAQNMHADRVRESQR